MLPSFLKWSRDDDSFCRKEFPRMWSNFVDQFVDYAFSGEPAASVQSNTPNQGPLVPTVVPAAKRLVAVGDLHGDYDKCRRAFRLAGLLSEDGKWAGGEAVCVQVGDIFDRGDHELKTLHFLERMQREASAAGGRVYVLNGNHEIMNVAGNYRYATAGSQEEIKSWHLWQRVGAQLKESCGCQSDYQPPSSMEPRHHREAKGLPPLPALYPWEHNPLRHEALRPAGLVARRFLADHPTVLQVGSWLFVHGGLLPAHVDYGLDRINKETRDWLLGKTGDKPPEFLRGRDALVWARDYSHVDERRCDCEMLQQVLARLPGAEHMVVGHTIQDGGINAACGGRVYRVDAGMSRGCGGATPQVLEVLEDKQARWLQEGQEPRPVASAPGAAEATPSPPPAPPALPSGWFRTWGRPVPSNS